MVKLTDFEVMEDSNFADTSYFDLTVNEMRDWLQKSWRNRLKM